MEENKKGRKSNKAERDDRINSLYEERVLKIRRVSAKRAGGSSLHFSALCAVGDHAGQVGVAVAKSKENINAIKKSKAKAKKNMFSVQITEGGSIPHEIRVKNGASILFMKPAPQGSGIIAGGSVRQVLDLAGYKNISAKIIGSSNQVNNAYVVVMALKAISKLNGGAQKPEGI
ncbi:hypothetical protein A2982_01590 [candidate division WWE3 bacterium RIFCSPLOWO2_01_FULL_39_13]|uniref:Small ribosomal subunit protein uS5 n=1 Tax=candidate division WWE3 bacterium RIFCSPLOWO2_01_FULL_39_13 TaxID=1802624 RepID=A0A1F4V4Q4_UNCKA|nr:MAG: hypothetical protein A2982_01590 [candidate division WWE3 bacterium RIFCSPLOWO2_01_FULL_39_13]